jgi:hypothetical protein
MKRISLFAFTLVVAWSGPASASTYWSAPGNSFVPTDASIQGDRYLITGATIKHKGANTNTVTAFAAVPPNTEVAANILPNVLEVAYEDSQPSQSATRVVVQFIRKARFSGTITTVQTFNSSLFSDSGTHVVNDVGFSHSLNFSANIYYFRADLVRGSSSETAVLHHVALIRVQD